MASCQALISEKVDLLDGRVFKTTGDGALAEFPSAVNAVRSAFEIRSALAGAQEPDTEPFRMRFGLHIADVVVQSDDLVGDGVNLAARIQAAAEPDSIYVSGALFDHVRRNSAFIFDDMGERAFKNITESVAPLSGPRRDRSASAAVGADATGHHDGTVAGIGRGAPFPGFGRRREPALSRRGPHRGAYCRTGAVSASFGQFAECELRGCGLPPGSGEGRRGSGRSIVLEGQVRKIGERVSISLTLSETDQGTVVWSDKIQRPFEEILALVDGTVARIAATVSGRMEDAAMVARRKPPENMTAFGCLLRGLDHHRLGGVTDDNARQAVGWLSKAIEADPHYAAAYAWRVCAASGLPGFDPEQGRRDICRALQLDPCDAEANRIMGAFELMGGNFDEALAHSRRAMELNPTDAYIKARCAAIFTFVGEAERSLRLLDDAEMLDPLLPVYCVEERGVALHSLGRYAEAIESLGRLTFQTNRSRLYRAAALVELNRVDEASRLVREAVGGKPDLTASVFTSGEYYRDPEKVRELGRLLRKAGLPP